MCRRWLCVCVWPTQREKKTERGVEREEKRALTSVVDLWSGGSSDLRHGRAHVQLSQSQLIHKVRQLQGWHHYQHHYDLHHHFCCFLWWDKVLMLRCCNCSTHSDSAQLLLYFVGHHVRPVFLSQEVPEDSTNESVGPGGMAHSRQLCRLTGALYVCKEGGKTLS